MAQTNDRRLIDELVSRIEVLKHLFQSTHMLIQTHAAQTIALLAKNGQSMGIVTCFILHIHIMAHQPSRVYMSSSSHISGCHIS